MAILTTACGGTDPTTTVVIDPRLPPAALAAGELDAAWDAMPGEAGGVPRAKLLEHEAWYAADDLDFGIEAVGLEEAFGPGATVDLAIELMEQEITWTGDCSNTTTWCMTGTYNDSPTVIWGDREGDLVFAAIAPDQTVLDELLDAWSVLAG